MAYYLVQAKAVPDKLAELQSRLDNEEIVVLRPFGPALDYSLKNARTDPAGWAVWEEEDYCRPPLSMERTAVLDTYFTELTVEKVTEGDGWQRIQELPSLWQTAGNS